MCNVNLKIGNTVEFSAEGEMYNIRDCIKDLLEFCQNTGCWQYACNGRQCGKQQASKNRKNRKDAKR